MASRTILERVVAAVPGDAAELWARMGQNRARQQHWSEAADCFSKALGLEPDALSLRINHMRSLLGAGDFGAARRVCSDIVGRFGDTDRPGIARNVATQCALIPGTVADAEVLVRIAERAADKRFFSSKHLDLHALGVALYRAGRFQEAVNHLNQAIDARHGNEEPLEWPFLAMAHYRLGHSGEARRWLDKLRNRQPSTDPNQFWKELEIRLLSSEAEAMVLYDPVFPADPFAH